MWIILASISTASYTAWFPIITHTHTVRLPKIRPSVIMNFAYNEVNPIVSRTCCTGVQILLYMGYAPFCIELNLD